MSINTGTTQHSRTQHNTTRHVVPYDGITAPLSLEAGTQRSGSALPEEYKPNTWYKKYDRYVLAGTLQDIFLIWSCQLVIDPALLLVLLFMIDPALLLVLSRSLLVNA
jgi:hypothetical protein